MSEQSASQNQQTSANEASASGVDLMICEFNRIRDELVSTLLYILGNREDAQDAAQDTFVKCWRAQSVIPEIHNLRAWIFRIGLNTAKDMQRSAWNRRVKPLLAEDTMIISQEPKTGLAIEDQETLEQLRVAILQLRDEEKEVFLLRQNGELTYEQIAEIRDLPVGTVKTQMRTALMKLRKVLNPVE